MGLREKVESELSVSDIVSIEELKTVAGWPGSAPLVRRMCAHLLAFLTTDDPRDNELDDANMRAVTAEVEADRLREARAALEDLVDLADRHYVFGCAKKEPEAHAAIERAKAALRMASGESSPPSIPPPRASRPAPIRGGS